MFWIIDFIPEIFRLNEKFSIAHFNVLDFNTSNSERKILQILYNSNFERICTKIRPDKTIITDKNIFMDITCII